MPSEIKTVGGFDDHLLYSIRNDPFKVREFETYGKTWIPLVNKLGGTHHGYYLPREGSDTVAVAMFSFPSLAAYENSRTAPPATRNVSRPSPITGTPGAS